MWSGLGPSWQEAAVPSPLPPVLVTGPCCDSEAGCALWPCRSAGFEMASLSPPPCLEDRRWGRCGCRALPGTPRPDAASKPVERSLAAEGPPLRSQGLTCPGATRDPGPPREEFWPGRPGGSSPIQGLGSLAAPGLGRDLGLRLGDGGRRGPRRGQAGRAPNGAVGQAGRRGPGLGPGLGPGPIPRGCESPS